jgi:hypothetical protein
LKWFAYKIYLRIASWITEYQWNTGILCNKKDLRCRRNMACYFYYFVESVECSNANVILKNHAEKEIQIVFTECGILPDNVNESSLNICSTHFSHILERNVKRSRRIYCEIPPCISTHPEARSTRKKDRLLFFFFQFRNRIHTWMYKVPRKLCAVTFQNVISVRENVGIILPVETCKCIRK